MCRTVQFNPNNVKIHMDILWYFDFVQNLRCFVTLSFPFCPFLRETIGQRGKEHYHPVSKGHGPLFCQTSLNVFVVASAWVNGRRGVFEFHSCNDSRIHPSGPDGMPEVLPYRAEIGLEPFSELDTSLPFFVHFCGPLRGFPHPHVPASREFILPAQSYLEASFSLTAHPQATYAEVVTAVPNT